MSERVRPTTLAALDERLATECWVLRTEVGPGWYRRALVHRGRAGSLPYVIEPHGHLVHLEEAWLDRVERGHPGVVRGPRGEAVIVSDAGHGWLTTPDGKAWMLEHPPVPPEGLAHLGPMASPRAILAYARQQEEARIYELAARSGVTLAEAAVIVREDSPVDGYIAAMDEAEGKPGGS